MQATTNKFGLIQFSAIPGTKPLSCPSHDNKGCPGDLSHNSSTLALVRPFVAALATVYQEPHFWSTEGQ